MHLRSVHKESSIPVLRQLIRDNPLGILTTAIRSDSYPLLQSTHIPFVLDVEDESSETELGRLRGHLARQNPQSKAMIESLTRADGAGATQVLEEEVLVLFSSPAEHYITPKFYVETKPTTGKVVGTWNYAAAQVYGKAKIYFDSKAEETISFLATQADDLSDHCETSIMGYTGVGDRPPPWKVSEAPERYVDLLRKNIIGIEIAIDRLEGKFKMSQEMSKGDREGVVQGLWNLESDVGRQTSMLVQQRSESKGAGAKDP